MEAKVAASLKEAVAQLNQASAEPVLGGLVRHSFRVSLLSHQAGLSGLRGAGATAAAVSQINGGSSFGM